VVQRLSLRVKLATTSRLSGVGADRYADTDASSILRLKGTDNAKLATSDGKTDSLKRLWGVAGIVGPIVGLAATSIAAHAYPQFSWTNPTQRVSDILFVSKSGPLMAGGLVASGTMISGAAMALHRSLSECNTHRIGSGLLIAGGVALGMVGLSQHGGLEYMHVPAAVSYFTLTTSSLLTLGAGFIMENTKRIAGTATTLAAAAALLLLTDMACSPSHMAMKEIVTSTLLGTGISLVSTRLFSDRDNSMQNSSTLLRK